MIIFHIEERGKLLKSRLKELATLKPHLIYWTKFDGKMGVATTCAPHSREPKSWPTAWTFWVNCHFEIMFNKFSGVTPALISIIKNK